jgi:hypothetical protein
MRRYEIAFLRLFRVFGVYRVKNLFSPEFGTYDLIARSTRNPNWEGEEF